MKYVASYNSLYVFPNKNEASKFFTECYLMSEGHEQQRYTLILMNLALDEKIARDFVDDECNEIIIKNSKFKEQYITVELNKWLSIEDTIKYYEEKIYPILEISEKYDVNFFHHVPFRTFGLDNKKDKNHCIANYYKDLLEHYNINVNSISDEYTSDGIHEITIDDKYTFNITIRDRLYEVISNVNSMIETIKSKEQEGIGLE